MRIFGNVSMTLGEDIPVAIKIEYHPPGTPPGTKIPPFITSAKWDLVEVFSGETESYGDCKISMSDEDKCTYLIARISPKKKTKYMPRYTSEIGQDTLIPEVNISVS